MIIDFSDERFVLNGYSTSSRGVSIYISSDSRSIDHRTLSRG